MDIIREAFEGLYPEKQVAKSFYLKYSGKFKPYNANVYITPYRLEFRLSKEWKRVNKEIQIGLIQSLFKKIYKTKSHTMNIDLYNIFIKRLDKVLPKTKYDPILAQSFKRNNEKYLYSSLDLSNLQWGTASTSKLGTYDYHTDTITISKILMDAPRELLDYVMYHEMLHKKIKYKQSNIRSIHHSKEFKEMEKRFENHSQMEKGLNQLCRQKRRQNSFLSPYKKVRKAFMAFKRR